MTEKPPARRILPTDQRDRLSTALLTFVNEIEEPLRELLLAGAEPGSRFDRFINEPVGATEFGEDPAKNALDSVINATISGLDHTRLLARSLADEEISFASATVTRGAIEAFARAWWGLSSDNASDLVLRWLSGMAKELATATRIDENVSLFDLSGREISGREQHTAVLDDIERLTGSRKPLPVSYTKLAVTLQDALNSPNSRAYYSHLSAVAHAELLGIHGFVTSTPEGVAFVTPEIWGVQYASLTFAAASLVVRNLVKSLGPDLTDSHPIVTTHDWVLGELTEAHRLAFAPQ